MTSLLQVSQYFTLHHYLFRSSKKQPNTYKDANQSPENTPQSKNRPKPDKGTAILQPAENLSLKDILRIKDNGKIKNPHFPVMKGIRNTKGASLCLPFMLGGNCDSIDPYGYHLQVNDPYRLPGTSNVDYVPPHDCLVSCTYYTRFSTAASQNAKLTLSSSP